eukprot:3751335-Rhodomonas_salina.1
MLPTYVIYLILEFTGVWSGYLVKGHEAGFGNTPEQNKGRRHWFAMFKYCQWLPRVGAIELLQSAERLPERVAKTAGRSFFQPLVVFPSACASSYI